VRPADYEKITNVAANNMKKTSRAYLKILFIIAPIGYLLAIYARTAWLAIEGLIGMDIPDILWVVFTLLAFSLFIKICGGRHNANNRTRP
jgi:hypothetical protein